MPPTPSAKRLTTGHWAPVDLDLDGLAEDRQVIVVTHLATIAAVAAHHLVVTRSSEADGPAKVTEATGRGRVEEIARMLAGDPSDPVAIAHAQALLAGESAVA